MYIDAHTHLDLYDSGDNQLVSRILEEIVQHKIFSISTAMDPISYGKILDLAIRCPFVFPAFGVHPYQANQYAHRLDELDEATASSAMIGEIGLDYYYVEDTSAYPAQREVVNYFLRAAGQQNKIVNLHTKGAEREILTLLERYDIQRAIVHWYSGPWQEFQEMAARGIYFTVGVEVLYSKDIRRIARAIPLHLLLTETDNPVALEWFAGKPGMPSLIADVVQGIAQARETTPGAILQAVHANLLHLFDNDPRLVAARALIKEL